MNFAVLFVVILFGLILVPPIIMICIDCFKMTLENIDELRATIRKFREKNYCRKCGVVIPRGEKYCRKCTLERWNDEPEY